MKIWLKIFQKAVEFLPQIHENDEVSGLMKCSGFINILRDSSSKCIMMEATSEMKMKKLLYLFNLSE
jgi:hypothetical protein